MIITLPALTILPALIEAFIKLMTGIIMAIVVENAGTIIKALVDGIIQAIPMLIQMLP